jgi:hypothetical protein
MPKCKRVRNTKFSSEKLNGTDHTEDLSVEWRIIVAAQSKAQVCGRALARIMGSNPTGGMDVCLL